MVGHADRRDDAVDREDEIEEHNLADNGRESFGRPGNFVCVFVWFDIVMDFGRRLED